MDDQKHIEAIAQLHHLSEALNQIQAVAAKEFNIFDAVGMSTQEIRHSSFLAFLFDPKQPHGIKNSFLKLFLKALFDFPNIGTRSSNKQLFMKSGFNTFSDFDNLLTDPNITVERERSIEDGGRIDIFIQSEKAKTLIVIENKVFTSTHDDQLSRYQKEFTKWQDWKQIFVYLTPKGDAPQDADSEDWCVFSYEEILKTMDILLSKQTASNESLNNLIKDYKKMTEKRILGKDKELIEVCKRIREEHPEAVEILFTYSDQSRTIINLCMKILSENLHGVKFTNTSTSMLDFYTPAAKKYFDKHDGGFEESKGGKFLYQIRKANGYKYCWFVNKVSDTWSEKQKDLAQKHTKSLTRKKDGEDTEKTSFCNLCNRQPFLDEKDVWTNLDANNFAGRNKVEKGLSEFIKKIRDFEAEHFEE